MDGEVDIIAVMSSPSQLQKSSLEIKNAEMNESESPPHKIPNDFESGPTTHASSNSPE